MKFQKVIITSGPTREWIDPVRYISNASSGKMGYCIALEMKKWISQIVYIHGNVYERFSKVEGAKNISIESTIQLRDALISELEDNCLVIMAAAPADFRPINFASHKIKKSPSEGLVIQLEQNPDVLKSVSEIVKKNNIQNVKLVGFAAETENLEENAKGKLERKGLTFIVGNYVGMDSGFGDVDSSIRIFSKSGIELEIKNSSKEQIAFEIVNFIIKSFSA